MVTLEYDKTIPDTHRSVSEDEYNILAAAMDKELFSDAGLPDNVTILADGSVEDAEGFACSYTVAEIGYYTYTPDEDPRNLFLLVIHNDSSVAIEFKHIFIHQLKVFIPPTGEYIMPEVTERRKNSAPVSFEWTLINNDPDGLHRYALKLPKEYANIAENDGRQISPAASITFPPKCQATIVVSNEALYATFSLPNADGNIVYFVPGTAQAQEYMM